jgi:hypothetical protein
MLRGRGLKIGMVVALTVVAAAFVVTGASAVTVLLGELQVNVDGSSTPKVLPKSSYAPITFHGSAAVSTKDGSHIPAAATTHLLVDKHFRLDTTGLPTCRLGEIEARTPAAAMKACGDALIGKGTSSAEVEFPEQPKFTAKGPLLAFNGPSGGRYGGKSYNEQLYYVYADVPAPTALIAVAKVTKTSGKYGYEISISIPRIAGGSGSFAGAEFTIGRKWTYKGKKHSFLSAECADGHLDAQVEVSFADGSDLTGDVIQACKAAAS